MKVIKCLAKHLTLIAFLTAPAAVFAGNIVSNGSFELGNFAPNAPFNYDSIAAGGTNMTDWTVLLSGVAWGINPTDATAASGVGYVDLAGAFNPPTIGAIQQSLSTTPFLQYLLSFDSFASVASVTIDGQQLALSSGTPFAVNGTVWTPKFGVFTATSTATVLRFTDASPGSFTVGVDSVSVVAVPEPATFVLLGAGVAALGLRRRRH